MAKWFSFLSILLVCNITAPTVQAQSKALFDDLKNGKWENLDRYIDSMKISLFSRNSEGYTPLHWVIKNFVDHDLSRYFNDKAAYAKNVEQYENYRKCMKTLLDKGADLQDKTPEGWNALQLAVANGKWNATDLLMDYDKNWYVRDKDGNTLLHLSVLGDNENTIDKFWRYLHDRLLSDKVNVETPNYAGQTPIAFFLSAPRKLYKNTNELIAALRSINALKVKDLSGRSAMDYAEQNNSNQHFALSLYLDRAEAVEREWEEFRRRFNQQVEENNRKREEYERRNSESSGNGNTLNTDLSVTYRYSCNTIKGGQIVGNPLDEPVTITIKNNKASISTLTPYYGSFTIEDSGYETIDGVRWEVYTFKQSNANSTYKGIAFPVGRNYSRAIVKTNIGFDVVCNN